MPVFYGNQLLDDDQIYLKLTDTTPLNSATFSGVQGQSVFAFDYVRGLIDVKLNGKRLKRSAYTATNGTSVTLATPIASNYDVLTIDGFIIEGSQNAAGNFLAYGGTANAITLTSNNAQPAKSYKDGAQYKFRATATNTGAATISVDGLPAKACKTITGAALASGHIRTDIQSVATYYSSTDSFVVVSDVGALSTETSPGAVVRATPAQAIAGTPDVIPDAEQVRKNHVAQVATIAALRALEPAFDGQQVELLGHTVAGLGGGMFYADYSSSSADDNGVTVVTSGGKRWVRKLDGFVTPEMFGALNGTDSTVALSRAFLTAKNLNKSVLLLGQYITTEKIEVFSDVRGLGSSISKISGVNAGIKHGRLIDVKAPCSISGFTIDSDVSADPASWDSSNYDSFTGWSGMYFVTNDVYVSDVVSENTERAGFSGWGVSNISLENCRSKKTRGNFGDGFFFYLSKNISHKDCVAEDFTRIGFVFDSNGSTSNATQGTYENCLASYGHDRSVLYGGGEYNSGFWAENTDQVKYSNCRSINSGDRGFVVAIGSGSTYGYTSQVEFSNCVAQNNNPPVSTSEIFVGFVLDGLNPSSPAVASAYNCYTIMCDQGFSCQGGITANIENCSYSHNGGGDQARAISFGSSATVNCRNFKEVWRNKPAGTYDPQSAVCSVGSFPGDPSAAAAVNIEGYRTFDGGSFFVKNLVGSSSNPSFSFKDCIVELCADLKAGGGLTVYDSEFRTYGSIAIHTPKSVLFENSDIFLSNMILIYTNPDLKGIRLSNSRVHKLADGAKIMLYRLQGSSSFLGLYATTTEFFGNVATGGEFIAQNAEPTHFNALGQKMIFTGCTFVNTGGSTSTPFINVASTSLEASSVHMSGCWKSTTLSSVVKSGFLASGSVVNDM